MIISDRHSVFTCQHLSAFSLAACLKAAKVEEVSTPGLALEALALVGVVRGPVGVEVMLLLRLPQPLRAPLVLGPCRHNHCTPVHLYCHHSPVVCSAQLQTG